jgi:hypothetical protein
LREKSVRLGVSLGLVDSGLDEDVSTFESEAVFIGELAENVSGFAVDKIEIAEIKGDRVQGFALKVIGDSGE